jgi:hypothetical protein
MLKKQKIREALLNAAKTKMAVLLPIIYKEIDNINWKTE